MAISSIGGPAISADLMYQFYDNKAITPKIRAAVQQRQNEADSKSGASTETSASASKSGPAVRVSITDQLVRMNMSNNPAKSNEAETGKPARFTVSPDRKYDVLTEVRKSVNEREAAAQAAAKAEKDAQLKAIADKVAESEKPATTPEDGE
ncbi:MAG: hypothetical protein FWC15_07095 [Fibromonadales bacterium]|nr:hypothetical protein [Fibromonadales bacterium]